MQAISQIMGSITCNPNNLEKYISLSLQQPRFIDRIQFLPTLLAGTSQPSTS